MPDFTFDEAKHEYRLHGSVIPSVTQLLRPLYDFNAVDRDVLKRAGAFGQAVHKVIELYLKDDLDYSTLDENLGKPLDGFRAWELDYPEIACELETAAIEIPMYHPRLKYAGTADICGEGFLIDLKSRPVNLLTDSLQLSGYDNFDTPAHSRDRYVLELKQDGTYVFTQIDKTVAKRKESWSRFRFLLDFYNAGQEIARWRNQ